MSDNGAKRSNVKLAIKAALAASFLTVAVWTPYVSMTPSPQPLEKILKQEKVKNADQVVGDALVATNIYLIDTLLNKNGGYTSNDFLAKIHWLDDTPSWELGVLYILRDSTDVLRTDISRSRSQSVESKFLKEGVPLLNTDNRSWWLPSTESQYGKAREELRGYLDAISDPKDNSSQFYARADNLATLLERLSRRLGSYNKMLSAATGEDRVNTDLANDASAQQSTYTKGELTAKTPWLKVDDVFYEARGAAWATLHILRAIDSDFRLVLEDKNASVSLHQIIKVLERTQEKKYVPMVLNGGGFGLTANHSLVLSSYISSASAQLTELVQVLNRG